MINLQHQNNTKAETRKVLTLRVSAWSNFKIALRLAGNNQRQQQVQRAAGYAAGDQGNEERQPEPKGINAKELGQTAAQPKHDPIALRAP